MLHRDAVIGVPRKRIQVFVISSIEAQPRARAIQSAFEYESFTVVVRTGRIFKVANYRVQNLEDQIDQSDSRSPIPTIRWRAVKARVRTPKSVGMISGL